VSAPSSDADADPRAGEPALRRPPSERESPLLRWRAARTRRRSLLPAPAAVPIGAAAALLGLSLVTFTFLGKEFLPGWTRATCGCASPCRWGSRSKAPPYVREMREQFLRFPSAGGRLSAGARTTAPTGAPDNAEFYVASSPEGVDDDKGSRGADRKMRAALRGPCGDHHELLAAIKDNVDEPWPA